MLRALVFDFDGTILDTETAEFYRWQALYQRYGLALELSEWQQGIGTWDAYDPWLALPEEVRSRREQLAAELHEQVVADIVQQDLRAGVRELLRSAGGAGYQLAIATSSGREWVEGWLQRHGLREQFAVLATRDDVARVKPNPELYILAVRSLGLRPEEALAVEDSLNGATAAIAAGLSVVVVPNDVTASQPFPAHWPRLSGFEDGLDALLAAAGAEVMGPETTGLNIMAK